MTFDLRCIIPSMPRRSRWICATEAIGIHATVVIWMSRGVPAPMLRAEDSPAHPAVESSLQHYTSNTGRMPVPRERFSHA
jgi:hypothetical protein